MKEVKKVKIDKGNYYKHIYSPHCPYANKNGYVQEHVYVWWEKNGIIPTGNVIHHINGNKWDNRIENLKCITHSEHRHIHAINQQLYNMNFYLFVFEHLKKGENPSKICSQLGITKQRLQYYLSLLKRAGFIKKVGYGTWEILKDFDQKEVKKSTKVTQDASLMGISSPDQVRGHAFQFKLKIPKLKNWDKREEILTKNSIKFEDLTSGFGKIGQKLIFKGRKIWLLDNSIIIYEKASYMSDTAEDSKSHAIYEFKALINSFARHIGADFNINGRLLFRISRQHYSLVKNALARQYDKEGKKLQVYDEAGFWLSIDNSFNLHELETLHPKTADEDNKKVQDFFNGIKQYDGFTPQFLMEILSKQAQENLLLAENIRSHLSLIQEVRGLVNTLKEKFK